MKSFSRTVILTRRRQILLAVLALAAAVVLALVSGWLNFAEPSYQGKPARYWLAHVNVDAFRAMGPEGAAYLGITLERKSSRRADKFNGWAEQWNLPKWARLGGGLMEVEMRRMHASMILGKLGPEGRAALPSLLRLFRRAATDPTSSEYESLCKMLEPMAPDLGELVPTLMAGVRSTPSSFQRGANFELLGAIGPKARGAVPMLATFAQGEDFADAAPAALALWRITRDPAPLLHEFDVALQQGGNEMRLMLTVCDTAGPELRALTPEVEKALRQPSEGTRAQAEILLGKINPERLRQIVAALNANLSEELQKHIALLASTNKDDIRNAVKALAVMGPPAQPAAPALVASLWTGITRYYAGARHDEEPEGAVSALGEIEARDAGTVAALAGELLTNVYAEPEVCVALPKIGPAVGAAAPSLRRLLDSEDARTRLEAARALAYVQPGDPDALGMLREFETNAAPPNAREFQCRARVALWKLGQRAEMPLPEVVADPFGSVWQIECLGEMGTAAREAGPLLEQYLMPGGEFRRSATMAIRKMDPNRYQKLGLPGLLIICPDKY